MDRPYIEPVVTGGNSAPVRKRGFGKDLLLRVTEDRANFLGHYIRVTVPKVYRY
ncbi:hypothetical protein AIOL_002673 [Candidatus Rhodobacter oscarellae]|uniref:Uncharacterized protein n=1 Tax=Candidatus Rhodobacter oscarellae TaxID=1675527 RepID=A0A0J9E4N2_9RHOB|nr:hypothetical protein [Candidatus Rhodobacter lobularis]KMW57706.1 hypothetical protein AIOL_002673 [Candidatus Rhodobacter lobularis]